ncbi:ankyrin repeat domain-containing protein [candidate division CSSED10-310 bacterium]|uniref:Ankyrin repeat domain-containing protein n=1 Tax=candidate division CSSED10-310 bacterium TaxID=2855610 RepID=A0ABV6Z299_UNCC1
MNKKGMCIIFLLFLSFIIKSFAAEIHDEVTKGNLEKVKTLLLHNKDFLNQRDPRQSTPLHFAAYKGHADIVEFLLAQGAELEPLDLDGDSPLHWAAQGGQKETVALLISQGAIVNLRDKRGMTALFFATLSGSKDVVIMLVDEGAELNVKDHHSFTPLHYAIMRGRYEIIDFMLVKGAAKYDLDPEGNTLLHLAAANGLKKIAALLIKHDLKVESVNIEKQTPLHKAAWNGHAEIVSLLLKHKADINAKTVTGDTPLYGAVYGGYKDVVAVLLQQGADYNSSNVTGMTPLDIAADRGHEQIITLLQTKFARRNRAIPPSSKKATQISTLKQGETNPITLTILYDNYLFAPNTKSDWGFSCLIQGMEKTILFDTGMYPEILEHNLKQLNVNLREVQHVAISHNHQDHTGSLFEILKKKKHMTVYLPFSFPYEFVKRVNHFQGQVISAHEPHQICRNVFLTGEMGSEIKEQSLILNTSQGLIIITGCSHPGIVAILKKAKEILDKNIYLVFGGFHLMRHSEDQVNNIIQQFKALGVAKCGATHCTGDKAIELFRAAYQDDYVKLGTGKIMRISEKGLQ